MKDIRRIGWVLIFALAISSAYSAQDPSVLLEKAIYAEETLGNLSEAIGIYQQVAASTEAGRATAALALFRLGVCYQKSGRTADAKAAFEKLTRLYPDQRELISKIPGASSSQLSFRQAPWIDGEVLRMAVKVRSGRQAGMHFYSVESVQESGKTLWKLRSVNGNIAVVQYTSVWMDAATYAPAGSVQNSGSYGEFQARYAPQQVEFVTTRRGSVSKRQWALDRPVYDHAQLAHLLRCLPLREGFQAVIPVANSEFAAVQDAKIDVVAREKLTVPAGIFDCYKAAITLPNQVITYWISTDVHAFVVKEDQGEITRELSSITSADRYRPVHYEDSQSGISLEAPYGWLIGGFSMMNENLICMIGPEAEAEGFILFVDREQSRTATSLNEDADKHIASDQKQYKEFVVRPESREMTAVSGLDAVRFIADFRQLMSEKETVRYEFLFSSPARWYEIRFQTGKGNFEQLRPIFDSIIFSLKVW